jgi:hypothetical protein
MKEDIPTDKVKAVIRSRMFLRQKRNGIIKSGLVAGGHMQDKTLYSVMNTSSPTVSTDSLLILSAVFAMKKCKIIKINIVAAYLNCKLEKAIYMSLDKLVSSLLVKLYDSYSNYVHKETGTIHVLLQKALYGLIESAKLFYNQADFVLMIPTLNQQLIQCRLF